MTARHERRRRTTVCPRFARALGGPALVASLLAAAGCGGTSAGTTSQSSKPSSTTAPASTSPARATTAPVVSASASTGHSVSASTGEVTATMRASTHTPQVERPWPIHVTVTRAGHPVMASVSYEFLFAGQVVARRSHATFYGRFSDVFKWPSSAVGYPLTFRAAIASAGARIDLDYPVKVAG